MQLLLVGILLYWVLRKELIYYLPQIMIISFQKKQYAGFIKINGFAGGFITSLDSISSFPVNIPLNIHVGYGFTLIDKYMWAGVGSRFLRIQ